MNHQMSHWRVLAPLMWPGLVLGGGLYVLMLAVTVWFEIVE